MQERADCREPEQSRGGLVRDAEEEDQLNNELRHILGEHEQHDRPDFRLPGHPVVVGLHRDCVHFGRHVLAFCWIINQTALRRGLQRPLHPAHARVGLDHVEQREAHECSAVILVHVAPHLPHHPHAPQHVQHEADHRDPEQYLRLRDPRADGPELEQEEDVGRLVVELRHRVHVVGDFHPQVLLHHAKGLDRRVVGAA